MENKNGESDKEIDTANDEKRINIVRTQDILRDVDEVFQEDQNRLNKKATPYVNVVIGALNIKTLIETGSQISLITKTMYDKIVKEQRCE